MITSDISWPRTWLSGKVHSSFCGLDFASVLWDRIPTSSLGLVVVDQSVVDRTTSTQPSVD